VLDLYSGVGNFTLPLAVGAKEAWGIEENPRAVEDARFNADQNGIPSCTFIQGKVEDVLKTLAAKRFEVVVLDPPRTGCKRIVNQITQLEPKRIIYVSCEPTTLARDLHLFLERGYRLEDLRLLDLFPQSYHMEVVALLRSPC
jgi:23S rRNA (uracil1939-C5)-methyltransferase